jgi:type IV pilus assembly protein PilP
MLHNSRYALGLRVFTTVATLVAALVSTDIVYAQAPKPPQAGVPALPPAGVPAPQSAAANPASNPASNPATNLAPSPPKGPPPTAKTNGATVNENDPNIAATSPLSGIMDPFDYDPRGRRDPFGQDVPSKPIPQGNVHGPLLPLQRFELNQLQLTGILWDVAHPKAMIKDPLGNIYVIGPNARIGPRNGYVAAIREGEIVVVETIDQDGRLISTAQVVKIAK